jgi:hypothetical protein
MSANVRFWHKADIRTHSADVRFGVKRTWLSHAEMSAYDPKRTFRE